MEENTKYYSLTNILSKKALYNVIFGERSNGKTYSVLEYALRRHAQYGQQLAVIRRWDTDFMGKRGRELFSALVENGLIKKLYKGKWEKIVYKSSQWYLAKRDSDLEKDILDSEPFAYAFALNTGEHDKSISFPKVTTILFDEFLTRKVYLNDEFIEFQNVLSTIIRDRDNVKIFMCGNTVNQYSPYYAEMGLTKIDKMEKGTIDVYEYGETGLTVAVEYSDMPSKKKKSDKYFAFDNPKLRMITQGAWEIGIYPHLPMKYERKDIRYKYFICFNNYILQCEIIQKDSVAFTYIHRKTTPLKEYERDTIFTTEYSYKNNYYRHITRPVNDITKRIWYYFQVDKVFYQDNNIGELVRNYVLWSKNDKGVF